MPCRNPCGLYIHLAFIYSVGPSSAMWSELGPATPFLPMECSNCNAHGLSLPCMKCRAQHFPSNLYPYLNHNHQQWPRPTHANQITSMYSKSMQCALPAYTKSWLDRTNKKPFIVVGFNQERFLVSIFLAFEKFDSDLELDLGIRNNIEPMPTQNPRAWVGLGMGTRCRALVKWP